MQENPQADQIGQWLKKLERESWQLELLVSAFTIFLLIQAVEAYSTFLVGLPYTYDLSDSVLTFLYVFMALLGMSIKALTIFMILHLMLRGFWIGSIGLRSVQANVDFDKLNYSDFFTHKLKKKVISLDNLVVMLDEICSLIFSLAFLIMSILLAFGLYLIFLGALAFSLGTLFNSTTGLFSSIIGVVGGIVFVVILVSGLVYFIDYFTLGFFKKFKWLSKLYYPFYRFYGIITFSVISKSIYYYLISKFSKKRIRLVYILAGLIILASSFINYDQYQYFPNQGDDLYLSTNVYDNIRPEGKFIGSVSIQSHVVSGEYLQLFVRYNPKDNAMIQRNCPDFTPLKKDGFNWRMKLKSTDNKGFNITTENFEAEDKLKLLHCLESLHRVSLNDSVLRDMDYYFFRHPATDQKGIMTMISTSGCTPGKNVLDVKKIIRNDSGEEELKDFAHVPFWLQ